MRNMQNVTSSMIKEIGTEGDNLMVRFNSGALYAYEGAAKLLPAALQLQNDGGSVGKYINSEVKPYHTATKIDE